MLFFFFKQKTAYEMRISDWSSDVCSSDLHYDIALRTKKNAPDLLFPVLTSALTNPTIRTELVKTLGGRPKWSNDFISHAERSDADTADSAAFFRGLQATSVPVPDASAVALIHTLPWARRVREARVHYS